MFVEERKEQILAMLDKFGRVKVKELSERFDVTEDCIRKDLASLEKRNLLKRAYGGAVCIRSNPHAIEVNARKYQNVEGKKVIAKKAVDLVQDGDVVFLDASTTNIEVAKLMISEEKKITIVTNMVEVLRVLAKGNMQRVIFIGGELNAERDGFFGCMAIQILSQFKFDVAFFGAAGINVYENEVSTYGVDDGLTKAAAIKASKRTYLLAEANKFNHDGNYKYAAIADFEGMISDTNLSEMVKEKVSQYDTVVI